LRERPLADLYKYDESVKACSHCLTFFQEHIGSKPRHAQSRLPGFAFDRNVLHLPSSSVLLDVIRDRRQHQRVSRLSSTVEETFSNHCNEDSLTG